MNAPACVQVVEVDPLETLDHLSEHLAVCERLAAELEPVLDADPIIEALRAARLQVHRAEMLVCGSH
jgi:hypothetical protein